MVSLTLITIGFLVVTAVVIALARGSTARWERDKRAPVAVRADVSTRRTTPARSALRIPGATTRRWVAALRGLAARFPSVKVAAQLMPKVGKQGTPPVRPIRRVVGVLRSPLSGGRFRGGLWTTSRSAAPPTDGDGADTAVGPKSSRAATGDPSNGASGTAARQLLRRTLPRARRRALVLLHRHDDPQDARVPHEDSDERPTAR
jgi:hypothetical protein